MKGSRLRKIRKSFGMTMKEFAKVTGYSAVQIQRMEMGKYKVSKKMELILSGIKQAIFVNVRKRK